MQTLNITPQELFSTDHLKSEDELIKLINQYINNAKNNRKKLEQIYKILRDLCEDV